MNEDLAHCSGEGAFVGLSAGQKTFDIDLNNGVELSGASGGHEKNATNFGATSIDGSSAGGGAAVVVERGHSSEGDELVAGELGDLRELCQQGPSGDLADPFDRGDEETALFDLRGGIDQSADLLLDEGDFLFKRLHVAAQGGQQ